MGSRRSSTAGLAGFLVELDRRLDSLGTGGVRAALRAAATRLTPSERPAFLALFDDDTAVDPPDDDLLEEIDTFVVGFPAAIEDRIEQRWRDQHGRGDWWDDDEESLGSDEVDELYLRLGDRFLAGDWAVATAGYRRLLHAAADDVDSPDGHIVGGSPEVVREALARLMRAVLADASTSPAERAAAAVDALEDHASTAGCPSLAEILGSHPAPVVDVDEVLVALGQRCEDQARTSPSWHASQFLELALDIAVAIAGPDALGRLARDREMPRRERAWQRWMVELATAGRVADAIEVGAEAIEAIGASPQRAHLADQYSGYQRRSGDHRGALTTGLVAFSDDPSLDRLRQLLDDADAADQPAPIDALRATAGSDPLVHVSVRLLAGLVDDVPRADERDRMHVSTGLDAPAVAIAALLRTSTSASGRHLRLCDARVGTLDRSFAFRDAMFELERDEEIEPDPEPSPLAPRVIKALESVTVDHDRLGVAAALLDAVAAEVMSNKWRSSYALVAQLVVALAHTNEAAGQGAAADVIAGYDRTYRRFAAFRKELLQAAKVI